MRLKCHLIKLLIYNNIDPFFTKIHKAINWKTCRYIIKKFWRVESELFLEVFFITFLLAKVISIRTPYQLVAVIILLLESFLATILINLHEVSRIFFLDLLRIRFLDTVNIIPEDSMFACMYVLKNYFLLSCNMSTVKAITVLLYNCFNIT